MAIISAGFAVLRLVHKSRVSKFYLQSWETVLAGCCSSMGFAAELYNRCNFR